MSGSFQPWLDRWGLVPDGEPFETPYTKSRLLPVKQGPVFGMLKVVTSAFEKDGGAIMAWWAGDGAAPVLARDDGALLLERAMGDRSLNVMAASGRDDEATDIICAAVARLHRPRPPIALDLPPLDRRFAGQVARAKEIGGAVAEGFAGAERLLAQPRDVVTLHGDIHHENILDFGDRGWLAIDPQGVVGERAYDYANLLRNPDLATALAPGRFARQLAITAKAAGLERERLLQWALAHSALSTCWLVEDDMDPAPGLAITEMIAAERDR